MHPAEIIEFMMVGIVIATIVIISLFLKANRRKFGWVLAVVILVAYCIFFIIRPFWIDAQINRKVELLRPYLEEHYPHEKWVISTVPHREDGFKHLNPYYIGVIFKSEPEVTYQYWIDSEDHIYQRGFITNNEIGELKHLEKRNE